MHRLVWAAGIGALGGIMDAAATVWLWHALTPDRLHWLNLDQYDRLTWYAVPMAAGWLAGYLWPRRKR